MEQETVKLLNVLRRIARAARYAEWTKSSPGATQFCVAQYNRVLVRLGELEPAVKPLFAPLSESASTEVIRMAARELIAYFEVEDTPFVRAVPRAFHFRCGPRARRSAWAPFAIKCD